MDVNQTGATRLLDDLNAQVGPICNSDFAKASFRGNTAPSSVRERGSRPPFFDDDAVANDRW